MVFGSCPCRRFDAGEIELHVDEEERKVCVVSMITCLP